MRIGIFTETYAPYVSGLVTSEVMLKETLEKMGHTVYVVTANLETFKYRYDEEKHILEIPGIKTGIYDTRLTSIYPIKAYNIVKKWNLDVIHSQTDFGVGTFSRLVAKQLNIPLVYTYHTMYEDYVHYVTKGHFNKPSKKIVEYLTLLLCDKTINELIVPTKKTYNLFKEKYLVDRNIYIIPSGIEIEKFFSENIDKDKLSKLRKKYKLTNKDYVGIFIGRLAGEKNITYLLEVVKKLKTKLNNFKLLIVGDGPDKDLLREEIKNLDISDNVIMTGKVGWEDTPYYYHLADIFLTASHSETQGLTVIEAMASEALVYVIEDDSFKETVTDNVNGLFFNNQEDLIKKIIDVYNDKDLYKKIVKQARIDSNNYSAETFAKRVFDVYLKAIEHKESNTTIIDKIVDKIIKDK